MEDDEDLGVLGYIPVVAGFQALSGVSDELVSAREVRDDWCEILTFYAAELRKRRAIAPEATAAAERKVYETQAESRADVRGRGQADLAKTAPKTDFMGSQTTLGSPLAVVTGFPARITEGFFGTFGLGSSQGAEERVAGLTRLAIAAVLLVLGVKVAGRFLAGGAAIAERSAVRATGFAEKVLDSPMPPEFM